MKQGFLIKSWISFLLIGLWSGSPAWAQVDVTDLPPVSRSYVLTNVTLHPQPGESIEGATLVIKDGLISAMGKNVRIPGEAIRLEADSMHVYAGFIDGMSQVGQKDPERERGERPQDPGNPPKDRAGIQPQREVMDLLDLESSDYGKLRAAGFTVTQVVPKGGMLPGKGAIILLAGEDQADMAVRGSSSMFVQFKGASGRIYPSNLLGVLATLKQMYRQAALAKTHEENYASNPQGMARPAYDPEIQAMYPLVNQEMSALVSVSSQKDVYRALNLQKELGFKLTLAGLEQGAYQVDALKDAGVPLFLSLDLPDKPEEFEADTSLSPARQAEQEGLAAKRLEAYEMALKQAAALQAADLKFGFATGGTSAKDLVSNLKRLVEETELTEDQALAALTTIPADMLDLSGQMGTLAVGKMANIIVTTEPVFAEKSQTRYVLVDGQVFEYEAKKKKKKKSSGEEALNVAGTWTYMVESPQGKNGGKIVIQGEPGDYEGTIASERMSEELELEDIEVDGSQMTFAYTVDAGGRSLELTVDVEIEGETFEGTISIGSFGSFPIEGERIEKPD